MTSFSEMGTFGGYFSHFSPLTLRVRFLEYKSRRPRPMLSEAVSSKRDRIMAAGPDPREQRKLLAIAYSASTMLTGPVLVGLVIDLVAGTMPWFMVGGVLVGMAGLTVQLIRFAQPKEPPK